MVKIGGNPLLAGAAVSYTVSVITFQALLSTTLQNNPYVVAASTALFSAAVPAVAYSAAWAIAKGGAAAEAVLFASLHLLLSLAFLRARELGFWASVTLSALAAAGLFLGKLAGGGRLSLMKMVMGTFATAWADAAVSDPASGECFLVVFALAAALPFGEVAGPEAGTVHGFVAGVFSPPVRARAGRVCSRGCKAVLLGCLFLGAYLYWWCFKWIHGENGFGKHKLVFKYI